MSRLQETFEQFQSYVLDKENTITAEIAGEDQAFRQRRMDVYHEGYSLRLLELLYKNFGALHTFVGDELFERFGRDYISSYPSNHFSIRYFGRHFSKFLTTHPDSDPLLVEITAYEWAIENSMDAADGPHLTFDELAKLNPESWGQLSLKLHPSTQILGFAYPTPELVNALQKEAEEEEEQATVARPELIHTDSPEPWLIWRFDLRVLFRSLSPEQYRMLTAVQGGQTFAEVCDTLCQFMEEDKVVLFAAENLRQWVAEGVFSEFQI